MPTTLLKNPVNVNVTSTAVGLYVAGTAASPTSAGGAQPSNTLTIDGTTGQETTGSGETAGAGANVSITAGTGGAAPSGSTNGAGGSVTINPGAPGAGAGTASVYGNVLLATEGGNVGIGTTAAPGTGTKGLILGVGAALASMASDTCGFFGEDAGGTVHAFAISEAGVKMQLTGAADNTLATAVQDNITRLGTVTSGSFPAANLAGTVNAASGGTGLSSYTTGDLLYASGAAALSTLADVAAGSYLRSGGVGAAPHWSTLKLPNAATANRIAYATSSNTYGESGNLTFNGTTLSVIGSFGVTGTGTANVNRTINVDTVDDGFTFTNQGTPSAGHVRYSPSLSLVGLARNPGGGGSTEAVTLRIYTKPVETAASPTGLLVFTGTSGTGTLVDMATLSTEGALSLPGGIQVGAPTGGDKGPGTVNVSGDYYRNGTAVFAQVDALLKKLDALTKRVGELESALTGTKAKRKSAEPKATKRTATKRTSRKEQR